jgi:FkbM family methyltransferase
MALPPIPHYKVSYAQNFEDLVLAGVLKSVSHGFYVDVGANHPELDSVTKVFYDKGWSGINVEPNDQLFAELQKQRPRDVNLKAAASSQPGFLTLRIYEGLDGLSTIDRTVQAGHAASRPGAAFSDHQVPVTSLAEILAQHRPSGDIHFLKVDVEGLELEVLLGNEWSRFRPWVLCLERNLDPARLAAIDALLGTQGYQHVFFDGINDFHVAGERIDIWHRFSYANDVVLNGVPVNYIFVRTMAELAAVAHGQHG